MIQLDKHTLRQTIKAKRLALSSTEIETAAQAFYLQLKQYFTQIVIPAKTETQLKIGIYLAANGELDLTPSINWLWQQGHLLYAPVLADATLSFHAWQPNTLSTTNQFGLLEPINSPSIAASDLDYVLVPLVAFTHQGQRLGMGKGYYDRTFAFRQHHHATPLLIGCAYPFQAAPELPVEPHDISLDFILLPHTHTNLTLK